jgi:hypothetical protein
MHDIVDKAYRTEELAPGLGANSENVLSLNSSATGIVCCGMMNSNWKIGLAEPSEETEFSRLYFSCTVQLVCPIKFSISFQDTDPLYRLPCTILLSVVIEHVKFKYCLKRETYNFRLIPFGNIVMSNWIAI